MDAARDAGQRDVVMQMGRRGDGHRIDAELEQRVDIVDTPGSRARGSRSSRCCAIRIGDADQLDVRTVRRARGHGCCP